VKRLIITTLVLAVISTALGARSNRQKTSIAHAFNGQGTVTANYESLIDRYFESLNETDPARRHELIKQVWNAGGTFAYPGQEVKGWVPIDRDIEAVQKKFPGAKVHRTSKIELIKNSYVRFNWDFGEPSEETLIRGVDFAVIEHGKLDLVVGFFDYQRDVTKSQASRNERFRP
jgi:hypothetical protein